MRRDHDQPFWINVEAVRKLKPSPSAYGMAMVLVLEVWWPTKEPFEYDPKALYERLKHTVADLTVAKIVKAREGAAKFFVILADGRWAPSPEYFSVTDGNSGGHVV